MTIAQETTIQGYQLRKGGTRARLAIFRMVAADSVNNRNPHTRLAGAHEWRKARNYTMKGYHAAYGQLSQGFNDKSPVWYSHTGETFRNERYCFEVDGVSRSVSRGWYCDVHQDETSKGIVASLTHGRFIAGYELSDSGERVYFGDIFTDESDAAKMADEHARVVAESMRDDSYKFNEAQKIEERIEERKARLCEVFALRNNAKFSRLRETVSQLCEAIRQDRETLKNDYAGVL